MFRARGPRPEREKLEDFEKRLEELGLSVATYKALLKAYGYKSYSSIT